MIAEGLLSLLFRLPRSRVGRFIVGIVVGSVVVYVGLRGLAYGEVWIPSSRRGSSGMVFGRFAGISASFGYVFLGLLLHYVGFWRGGRLEELRHDVGTLLLCAACAASAVGFFVLALLDR